jgi:hypothetical protein
MRVEQLDRRVLGALRLIDAPTHQMIRAPLSLSAAGARLVRNRSGLYVLFGAPGLRTHIGMFDAPPSTPALGSLALRVTISDSRGVYLPRQSQIRLPRDPAPQVAPGLDSLFRPIDITLFPAPSAAVEPGWALVRVTVMRLGVPQGIAGALLRVLRTSDSALLARGQSDARGEALVAVPGVPITTWGAGNGAVLASAVDATLEVFADPNAGPSADPDDLEARRATLRTASASIKLTAGKPVVVALEVPWP